MSLADMFFKPALFSNPLITVSVCIDHYVDPNIFIVTAPAFNYSSYYTIIRLADEELI